MTRPAHAIARFPIGIRPGCLWGSLLGLAIGCSSQSSVSPESSGVQSVPGGAATEAPRPGRTAFLSEVPESLRPAFERAFNELKISLEPASGGSGGLALRLVDAQLESLEQLAGPLRELDLRQLYLEGDALTDAELIHLNGLSQLRTLHLYSWQDRVTDSGLQHLQGLVLLSELEVYSGRITDGGLSALRDLVNLTYVFISSDHVTDAGLVHFHPLKRLRVLCFDRAQVTAAGRASLKEALPRVEMHEQTFAR